MTVALAGRTPATFEIKSANLPLVALLLKSADLRQLSEEFATRFGDIPDFFDHDPLIVDLSPLQGAGDIDFARLRELLARHRVHAVAVKGGSEAQMAAALHCGLVPAPEASTRAAAAASVTPPRAETPAPVVQPPDPLPAQDAMVIDKPLRSGQQVYARGRDLIVLSMVNPGAEVIADGHIHVYAPLRGKAIAGARGNVDARIFTLCLEPELVSIAGVYRTSDVPLPVEVLGRPAQVRLAGGTDAGKLVMQSLKS